MLDQGTKVIPLAFEITKKCYSQCSHCYLSCTPQDEHLSFDRIEYIISKISNSKPFYYNWEGYQFSIQSITGGDPFVYQYQDKNLYDVLSFLWNDRSIDIHVDWWTITPTYLDKLKELNISYYMSFTSFMPNYQKRFWKSFDDLLNITGNISIDIIDNLNGKEKILNELDFGLLERGFIWNDDFKKNKIESWRTYHREGRRIKTYFKLPWPVWRGKDLCTIIPEYKKCIHDWGNIFLYLDIMGNIYPCARSSATHLPVVTNIFNKDISTALFDYCKHVEKRKVFMEGLWNSCNSCLNHFDSWMKTGIKESLN